jgi:hypothetical protein
MTLFFDAGSRGSRQVEVAEDARSADAVAPLDPRARHRPDHRRLVGRLPPLRRLTPVPLLDGVMVVTCRGSGHRSGLTAAARIATRRKCPLVVLVAGDAATRTGKAWLLREFPAVVVLDVRDHADRLPDLAANRLLVEDLAELSATSPADRLRRRQRILPIGPARNLALLDDDVQPWRFVHPKLRQLELGRMLTSWRYSLWSFRTLNDRMLNSALTRVSPTGKTQAVGWISIKCSDNSVVCRSRRYLGHRQERFISTAALLIGVSEHVPFFPTVYNEDWLFLLELMLRGRDGRWDPHQARRPSLKTVQIAGTVHQDRYDVFHSSRAPREERGDVLAEGLFGLLHCWQLQAGLSAFPRRRNAVGAVTSRADYFAEASTRQYWQSVVACRREMVEDLLAAANSPVLRLRLGSRHEVGNRVRRQIINALTAALAANGRAFLEAPSDGETSGVQKLSSYLDEYCRSLEDWRNHLAKRDSDWALEVLGSAGWKVAGSSPRLVHTSGGPGNG